MSSILCACLVGIIEVINIVSMVVVVYRGLNIVWMFFEVITHITNIVSIAAVVYRGHQYKWLVINPLGQEEYFSATLDNLIAAQMEY